MKICVPTSWDNHLIEEIRKLDKVCEVFGAARSSPLGGGRPAFHLPEIGREEIKAHIDFVRSCGLKFDYLINSPCFGGREFDREFRKRIFEYLDWVDSLNVDSVTISNPYLLELIRKEYPAWRIKWGLFGRANSLSRIQYLADLGVERITLPLEYCKTFDMLKKIRRNTDCELVLLANQSCIWDCPLMPSHSIQTGHFSQEDGKDLFLFDSDRIKCCLAKLDPEEFIKGPHIRPEDRYIYEDLGIDYLKIGGRTRSAEWILRCAKAYSEGKYDGNLLDLMDNPFLVIVDRFPYYVDNPSLEGYLDFFLQGKCPGECKTCNYCAEYTARAVKPIMSKKELSAYREKLELALAKYLARDFTGVPEFLKNIRDQHIRELRARERES